MIVRLIAVACFVTASFSVTAANYPCSKSKGGVAYCQGSKFVCNDGSISQSKRVCSASAHGSKGEKKSQQSAKQSKKNQG